MAEPKKVMVQIPLELGTDTLEVGINGKYYSMKRGEVVDVPENVARVVQRSARAQQGRAACVKHYLFSAEERFKP